MKKNDFIESVFFVFLLASSVFLLSKANQIDNFITHMKEERL